MTRSERIRMTIVLCLLGAGALLAIASLAGFGPDDLRARLYARPEDGSWSFMSIDGRTLPRAGYLIGIREGQVRSGRDGCNNWSYNGAGDNRMMTIDLQECPRNAVATDYWAIVRAPTFALVGDRRMRITAGGHVAELRRCQWRTVRRVSAEAVSETRECDLQ